MQVSPWLRKSETVEDPGRGCAGYLHSRAGEFHAHLEAEDEAGEARVVKTSVTLNSILGAQLTVLSWSRLEAEGGRCCHLEIWRDITFDINAASTQG